MKIKITHEKFDTLIQITDWRFSATAVGLALYFEYFNIEYQFLSNAQEAPEGDIILGFDGIMYNESDIDNNQYLEFAEHYFEDDMTHIQILKILENDEFDDEKIKTVNNLIDHIKVLKSVLKEKKFDGSNKEYFITAINENRLEIVQEIFQKGNNLYKNYCNPKLLMKDKKPHCRLVGYTVDEGRKSKFLGFGFSKESFVGNDIREFDFIPFAFSKTHESYFINNNFSMQMLIKTKQYLDNELDKIEAEKPRTKLFILLKKSADFINYEVEIITKSRNEDMFKTLFVRFEHLKKLRDIPSDYISFKYESPKLDLEPEVYERCLNGVILDDLIERMLKISIKTSLDKTTNKRAIKNRTQLLNTVKNRTQLLININIALKGEPLMNEIDMARKMGFIVSQELIKQKRGTKVISYKQKIIGALVAHDYDRMNEVILSLAAYVGMEFAFAYPLFENPEENKNIAFSFANALTDIPSENKNTEGN